jgi:O-antigen/teichoic acid export membrane protein
LEYEGRNLKSVPQISRISRTFGLPKSVHAFGVNILLLPLGIATSVLIARTVGPAGKGSLDLILATAGLLTMLLSLSLPPGITYVVAQRKVNVNFLASQLVLISLLQAFLALVILSILRSTGYSKLFLPNFGAWILVGLSLYVCVDMLSRFWASMLAGRQQIAIVNNSELVGRVAQFIILFTLAGGLYLSGKQMSAALLFLVCLAVSILINLLLVKSLGLKFGLSADIGGLKAATAFALPCYIANSAQFLNYKLDIFIVSFFAGSASVGRYTLAVSLAQLLWLMSNSVASVLLPKVAASTDIAHNIRHTSRVTRLSLWASAICALALGLLATQAIPALYGEAFRPSINALLCILPGVVIFSIANVLAAYIAGIGKPHLNLVASCLSLIVTIVLDLTLIPRLNIVGASIASTASYGLASLLILAFFIRETGAPLREILLPTLDDFRLLISLARPALRRVGFQGA